MKKHLLLSAATLAVAMQATPALADFTFGNEDRNVTVYGRIDLGVASIGNGTSRLANAQDGVTTVGKTNLQPGADSWFGINAEMKLDDDLKSYIKVQQRFNADTGQSANSASQFYGWSYVGLQKIGVGAVELGREYAPMAYIALEADPFRWDTVANIASVSLGTTKGVNGYVTTDVVRYKNGIYLKSDSYNGFKAVLGYSFQENDSIGITGSGTLPAGLNNAGNGVGSELGATLEYREGKMYAGLGYDRTSRSMGGVVSGQDMTIATLTYDFGSIKPMLSTTHLTVPQGSTTAKLTSDVYSLGAIAPIGKGDLKMIAANVKQSATGTATAYDYNKYGIGYHYWIKKVSSPTESYGTKVYVDLATAKTTSFTRTNAVDVGVMVTF